MFKKIRLILFTCLCLVAFTQGVMATGSSIKAGSSSITKGKSTTITLTVSSDSPLVSIEGSLQCSGAGVSGGLDLNFDDGSNALYSKTYNYSIKPTTTGTVKCSTNNVRLTNMASDNWIELSSKNVSVTVKEPEVVAPKTYSSNNYLSKLSIKDATLTPGFEKDTLEYTVSLEPLTKEIVIEATAEDKNSSIKGMGTIGVTEGVNNLTVVVTAENGNTREYKILATVKELSPIEVNMDNNSYTIVRNIDSLEVPSYFKTATVTINNEEVPAFTSDIINLTLVALKDETGNINLYIYDSNNQSYTKYVEITSLRTVLYIKEPQSLKDIPKTYKKTIIVLNNNDVTAYKIKESDDFALIYGVNIETGKEGWYSYHISENTLQAYNKGLITNLNKKISSANTIIVILTSVIGLFIIVAIIYFVINFRKKQKLKHKTISKSIE